MIVERWLPELERHEIGRREERRVGAEAGERRDEERAAIVFEPTNHRGDFGGGDAGNVARNGQEPIGPRRPRRLLSEGDGFGVTAIRALDEAADPVATGHAEHVLVGRNNVHRAAGRRCEREQHVLEHGLGEHPPFLRGEDRHQTLLGIHQILDGDRGEHVQDSTSRTRRASAASSARLAMMVGAVAGDTPSCRTSEDWAVSRSSKTSTSSQGA